MSIWKKVLKCVCLCVCPDLLGLCSCHSNNAADALSDGLLWDDDKRSGVTRVLQMAADNRKQQHRYTTAGGRWGEGGTGAEQRKHYKTAAAGTRDSLKWLQIKQHQRQHQNAQQFTKVEYFKTWSGTSFMQMDLLVVESKPALSMQGCFQHTDTSNITWESFWVPTVITWNEMKALLSLQ